MWVHRVVDGRPQQLCTGHILQFGNEEQKQKWLPKLASGEWIGAWGLTEANTGSDAMRMRCVAERDGDGWILNGTKNWITHGITGDVAVVLARTGISLSEASPHSWWSGARRILGRKKENKLGMRSSETAEMIFDQCRIPTATSSVKWERGSSKHENPRWRPDQHCLSRFGNGQRALKRPRNMPRSVSSSVNRLQVSSHCVQACGHGNSH